jgi:alpha-maltose-1-phosphate synthase
VAGLSVAFNINSCLAKMGFTRFAMAGFARSGIDNFALALEKNGLLDFYALGTRKGAPGIPPEHTRLQPAFGLVNMLLHETFSDFRAESCRFRLFPLFDRWVRGHLQPGQHFFAACSYGNRCMARVKEQGGLAFADAGNAHPAEFWKLLSEEQQRWESPCLPVSPFYRELTLGSVAVANYITTPSTFVRNSFLKQGFAPERLLLSPYPVDLGMFRPASEARPRHRPFTIVHVGGLTLRKGAPYLLEAFKLIRKEVPDAVLRAKHHVREDTKALLARYKDLPIEWSGKLALPEHVRRYQTSDLLLFPSVEDGFAFVVAEALACGLPVVTTTNTGASDLIRPGENGEVVPIRDPEALAKAALKWWDRIRAGERVGGREHLERKLSFEQFEETFMNHLERIGLDTGRPRSSRCSSPTPLPRA